jgi:hypothetical protein
MYFLCRCRVLPSLALPVDFCSVTHHCSVQLSFKGTAKGKEFAVELDFIEAVDHEASTWKVGRSASFSSITRKRKCHELVHPEIRFAMTFLKRPQVQPRSVSMHLMKKDKNASFWPRLLKDKVGRLDSLNDDTLAVGSL